MLHFVRWFLNNPFISRYYVYDAGLRTCFRYVETVHKYGWEHWEHSRELQNAQMSHRMDQIKPPHYVTREECQEMIDDAIRKHNRNAGIISMCVGWVVLALFAEGLLRLIGVIDPLLPWY